MLKKSSGFSLVELLVALTFTGLLMAGLTTVFRNSTQSFRSESEKLSSSRRNRLALELLRDDLDGACQTLGNISFHTINVRQDYPLFAIYPDSTATKDADERRDWIQFFYEESLPFEGRLYNSTGGEAALVNRSLDVQTAQGSVVTPSEPAKRTFQLNFRTSTFRNTFREAVKAYTATTSPIHAVYKDNYRLLALADAADLGTTACTVTVSGSEDTESGGGNLSVIYGLPSYTAQEGTTEYTGTNAGAPVTLIRPRLLVRYSIEDIALDPSDAKAKVPCLVKRVVPYDTADDTGDPDMAKWTRSVVAEDVIGLKVSVSVDSGANWIIGGSEDRNGTLEERKKAWTSFRTAIAKAIKKFEDPSRADRLESDSWMRYFPMLVRLDLTTRTANKRVTKVVGGKPTPTYSKNTRVLIAMPRYFGMPLTSTM